MCGTVRKKLSSHATQSLDRHTQAVQHLGGQDESQTDIHCKHHVPVVQGLVWPSKHARLPLLTCTDSLSVFFDVHDL